jgi:hypothetical protein
VLGEIDEFCDNNELDASAARESRGGATQHNFAHIFY